MNETYEDPFLPLPQLPGTQPELLPVKTGAMDENDLLYNAAISTASGLDNFNFDANSFEDMRIDDESDCSDESDIDIDQFDEGLYAFEPTPIDYTTMESTNEHTDHIDEKKVDINSRPVQQPQEDSLGDLPFISTTSSLRGFGGTNPLDHAISEHSATLTATSHTSNGGVSSNNKGDDASNGNGYSFYKPPTPWNFTRPSYVKSEQNWETHSGHSNFSGGHSIISSQSAPVVPSSAKSLFGQQMQQQNPRGNGNFAAETCTTSLASSSCNDFKLEMPENYFFYSRPQTSYVLKRPEYVKENSTDHEINAEISEFNLEQFRVGSPEKLDDLIEGVHKSTPDQIASRSFHKAALRRESMPSRKGPGSVGKRNFDTISCESMPAALPSVKVKLSGFESSKSPSKMSGSDDNFPNFRPSPLALPKSLSKQSNLDEEASSAGCRPKKSSKKKSTETERCSLVLESDRELATKFSFAVLSEYGATTFVETDRQGKRKGLAIGFPGLSCMHCDGNLRKGGRFFPSTIKTMADTKKTLISIYNHLLKCNNCPEEVKKNISHLRQVLTEESKKQKYGSQKAFFLNIWTRLHGK